MRGRRCLLELAGGPIPARAELAEDLERLERWGFAQVLEDGRWALTPDGELEADAQRELLPPTILEETRDQVRRLLEAAGDEGCRFRDFSQATGRSRTYLYQVLHELGAECVGGGRYSRWIIRR